MLKCRSTTSTTKIERVAHVLFKKKGLEARVGVGWVEIPASSGMPTKLTFEQWRLYCFGIENAIQTTYSC